MLRINHHRSRASHFVGLMLAITGLMSLLALSAYSAGSSALSASAITAAHSDEYSTEPTPTPGVSFLSPTNSSVAGEARSVAVGDFNRDSKPDLAVANGYDSHIISVLLGNGDGTFQPAKDFGVENGPLSIAVTDFNGDGKPDLAVANYFSSTVSVLLGNGDGTFGMARAFSVGAFPRSVAVGDFNGDGKPDLVVVNFNSTVSVLLGNGDGTFQAAVDLVGSHPFSVTVAAFNGDGKPDLAVLGDSSNSGTCPPCFPEIAVLLGKGDGTFQEVVSVAGLPDSSAESVAVGDFNSDGKLDLAMGVYGSGLSVFLGNGDGTFGAARNFETELGPVSLAIRDFNGDGRQDLAIANFGDSDWPGSTVSVLLGNGDGTFQTPVILEGLSFPASIAVADFNGDGKPDLTVGNAGVNAVSVLINTTPNPNPNLIDDARFFVSQHYRDFLNREPDADGLAFWTREIVFCGGDVQCIEVKRINVSAAFFLSIEFQQTGYLVYRIYKASYGDLAGIPVPIKLSEFLPDTQEIGQNVIVNQPGWEQLLENNTQAFTAEFVQRPRFTSAFPTSMTPSEFVDELFANADMTPAAAERADAINEFGHAPTTADVASRARALRRVAENATLAQQEFNRAFVLMQYFGYLRRNPNDPPELTRDFQGYNFWLNKLNQFNGDFVDAEMVKSFIVSGEYRQRFGP